MCYPGFKELYKRFYTSHALKPYNNLKIVQSSLVNIPLWYRSYYMANSREYHPKLGAIEVFQSTQVTLSSVIL